MSNEVATETATERAAREFEQQTRDLKNVNAWVSMTDRKFRIGVEENLLDPREEPRLLINSYEWGELHDETPLNAADIQSLNAYLTEYMSKNGIEQL